MRALTTTATLIATAGCQLQSAPTRRMASTEAASAVQVGVCSVLELERYPLSLPDGRALYVEPQALQRTPDGYLLAGSPTFVWSTDVAGAFEERTILGVRVTDPVGDRSGRAAEVRVVPRPEGVGHLGGVRAARLGAGRWGFLLEEVTTPSPADQETIRVAYAELDGERWSPLEDLPLDAGWTHRLHLGSDLVARDGILSWLVPVRIPGRGRLAYYERAAGRWSARTVLDEVSAGESALAEHPGSGRWLGIAAADPALEDEPVSLRLLSLVGSATGSTPLYVGEPGAQIFEPRFTAGPAGFVAGWIVQSQELTWSAWGATVSSGDRELRTFAISDPADEVLPLTLDAGHAVWLVHRPDPNTHVPELRVYRARAGAPELIGVFDHPFRGYFAAVATDGAEFLVVGPQVTEDPTNPIVRSLVLRLSISCT